MIVAHNTPAHVARVVSRLSAPTAKFFIHVDRKSDLAPYAGLRSTNAVLLDQRIPIYWADYSLVEATLLLIRQALDDPMHFDRLVLLSGADYPLHSAGYLESFFSGEPQTEFIELVQMPNDRLGKPISRLTHYLERPCDGVGRRLARRLLVKLRLTSDTRDYRKVLNDLTPYGGATWWALTRPACEYIADFSSNHQQILEFYKNTFCPDECIFQTILGNSPFSTRTRPTLTWTDWSAKASSPSTLTADHLLLLRSMVEFDHQRPPVPRQWLFARKFNDESADLLNDLDNIIAASERRIE